MTNKHTARAASPDPADIVAARHAAKLTQGQAASVVHASRRTWQQWEAGDRRMHPGLWALFLLRQVGLANALHELGRNQKVHNARQLDLFTETQPQEEANRHAAQ